MDKAGVGYASVTGLEKKYVMDARQIQTVGLPQMTPTSCD